MPSSRSLLVLALCVTMLQGCSSDSPTEPAFPDLPAAVVTAYCVRGDRAVGQSISGTVATTDCPVGNGAYHESYRVRVSTTGSYQFSANSAFDNVLAVMRLESTTVPGGPQELLSFLDSAAVTLIDFNDDRSGSDLNALIAAVDLTAGTDYFIVVSGYDGLEVGPYTVTFTKN